MFRYLAARLRHPGLSAKHHLQAGIGLDRRSRDLSAFWSEHQSRSRAAQARWSLTCGGDVLTVLGAGPLRDFNAIALAARFKRFRLVDANPLSPDYWGRLNTPVEPVVTDVSGCLAEWLQAIKDFKGDWSSTMAFVRDLGRSPLPAYSVATDAILSLNLLSQLEVGWQEMVEPIFRRRFGLAMVRKREQEWLDAIRPGSQTLVEQHLAAIEASQPKSVLLITDVEYADYTGRQYSRKQSEPPPLTWSAKGWQADPGIQYELTPALEGVDLNTSAFARWMPSFQLEWCDNWLWHIAPNGTETTSYGKLHRVAAFALRRYLASTSD